MKKRSVQKLTGKQTHQIAFPLGGLGAGMVCLEGHGALGSVSLRHHPEPFNTPAVFAALCLKGKGGRAVLLEGPLPDYKVFGPHTFAGFTGGKVSTRTAGLPRFSTCSFEAVFPFSKVTLSDKTLPVRVEIGGWSPFVPADADNSSLPVASLEYTFTNESAEPVEAVFSFNAENFMHFKKSPQDPTDRVFGSTQVRKTERGFILCQDGTKEEFWQKGCFCVQADSPGATVNPAWFRGGWFDSLTMAWKDVESGECINREEVGPENPSPGGSLFVPVSVEPGASKTVRLLLSWYVPHSHVRTASPCDFQSDSPKDYYRPWYSERFKNIEELTNWWVESYEDLRSRSERFAECLSAMTLDPAVKDAVSANLSILKSPTCLRQHDGRPWLWEGSCAGWGCCAGSCTHVWNYAQAIAHLFPDLERSLRETELNEALYENGLQSFRVPLPIRHEENPPMEIPAADGQLGGVMQIYREWRVSGDTGWLKAQWPSLKKSLSFCIQTWDPSRKGVLEEPHHNTYDIEFWGADGMCTSIYLGALKAAGRIAEALGEDASEYVALYKKGRTTMESELFSGEYFIQTVQWKGLKAPDPTQAQTHNTEYSEDGLKLLKEEGPKYQYGDGCLSDGVFGAWMAEVCGLGEILDPEKVKSHLLAVYRNNFKTDLSLHANPQRPEYALGNEGGLLLCTWPNGNKPSLPFPYSNEVWTGIEYQVASHLMMTGCVKEGLEIVKTCRARYDGHLRNPFNEIECGHWYGRALSSYALLQSLTGIRYDAVEQVLYLHPQIDGDFATLLCTATGYGLAGIRNGQPFIDVKEGEIPVRETTVD